MKRKRSIAVDVPALRVDLDLDKAERVKVDIEATVTPELIDRISQLGGDVISSVPKFRAIRAWLPVEQVESLATRNDVKSIKPAARAFKNAGSVTSQGDSTHLASITRGRFGATGRGVRVGVLSDSVDHLSTSQALGDLGMVNILPGQAGIGSGEGTAMLEIIHDLAPDAELYFATAFTSAASFAQNILDLAQAGCSVIVDDVIYINESPFQDDIIAQAVNSVTSAGVLYFSSAGNSGNKTDGRSGTWEGDFRDGGKALVIDGQPQGRIHDFGGKVLLNRVTEDGLLSILFWSDPLGASSNDYDLYILNERGTTVVGASTAIQNGSQDPIEIIGATYKGEQIVIVQFSGEPRFLHFENFRGRLTVSTAGNIRGHNSAADAFAVAAAPAAEAFVLSRNLKGPFPNPFNTMNQIERFSSDGPRRIFFEQDGTPITPGNFLSTGGRVRQKPDLTAADGVVTTLPTSSGLNPFFGTSAAAPHAAAIAALVKSYRPDLTPAQIRTALTSSAIDIEATGVDRDSGHGIVMADRALAVLHESFSVLASASPVEGGSVVGAGTFSPLSSITLTAIPASGFRFVNWTEGESVADTSSSYAFPITHDRTLVANFALIPKKGTYFGLITTDPATHEASGQIRIALISSGTFSASLSYGGMRSTFDGKFDSAGRFGGVINHPGGSLEIYLSLDTSSDRISGFVRDRTNIANVVAERAAFDAKTNPAPQAGKYTLISMPAAPFKDNPMFPQGFGAGAMVVDKAGRVRIAKTFGDGTKAMQASALSADGSWPFYATVYQKRGTAIGLIRMEDKPTSDADGIVNWFKPPLIRHQSYPTGFNMQSVFLVSRYTEPATGERILPFPDTVDNGLFTINGGNLNPVPVPKLITLNRSNEVMQSSGDKLKFTFLLSNGQFSGTFIDPGNYKSRRFVGAVFQKQGSGAGWFRGNRAVGNVFLEPSILPSPAD